MKWNGVGECCDNMFFFSLSPVKQPQIVTEPPLRLTVHIQFDELPPFFFKTLIRL